VIKPCRSGPAREDHRRCVATAVLSIHESLQRRAENTASSCRWCGPGAIARCARRPDATHFAAGIGLLDPTVRCGRRCAESDITLRLERRGRRLRLQNTSPWLMAEQMLVPTRTSADRTIAAGMRCNGGLGTLSCPWGFLAKLQPRRNGFDHGATAISASAAVGSPLQWARLASSRRTKRRVLEDLARRFGHRFADKNERQRGRRF